MIPNPQRPAVVEIGTLCLGLIHILMKLCALMSQKDERLFCFYKDVRMVPSGAEVAFLLKRGYIASFLVLCFAYCNKLFANDRMQFIISLKKHSGPQALECRGKMLFEWSSEKRGCTQKSSRTFFIKQSKEIHLKRRTLLIL